MTMKLRNRLIALICLIIFLGLGAALFLSTSARKPFAVILFVGDNINSSSLTAARLFSGGGDARLQMESLPNAALCRNAANDFSIPDNASASTAISAGKRVNRGSLCTDPSGTKMLSLLEIAASRGRSTGLITIGPITGTTAAAYYAKSINPADQSDLASQFSHHAPFDVVIGGDITGTSSSTNAQTVQQSPLQPKDKNGIAVFRSMGELEGQPFWKSTPVLGLFPPNQLSLNHSGEGDPNAPSLSDLVRVAIRHLQANRHGYFLVVDDPEIGISARANDAESMFKRILAFDQAVSTARRYAGDNSIILVTGRENIGGLQLNGYPFLGDKGVAVLSLNAQGNPSLSWATGPGFAPEDKNDAPQNKKAKQSTPGILSQPSAYSLPQALGVADDVLTLGVGQGSEKLKGFLDLTDIHRLINEQL